MTPARRIQWIHLANMVGFLALAIEAFGWQGLPPGVGLAGVAVLYGGLWAEARAVHRLLAGRTGPLPTGARSMLMTRLLIGALSVVVIAAELGRLRW